MADYSPNRIPDSVKARFWARVEKRGPDDCWPWDKIDNISRYGRFSIGHKTYPAHRFSLIMASGFEPDSKMFACHSCDNRRCVNPNHLHWGDHVENMREARDRGTMKGMNRKTHCKRGHPLTDDAVYLDPNGNRSGCKKCCGINLKERRARDKAAGIVRARPSRAKLPKRTHCKWGHPFVEGSVYIRPNGKRGSCIKCNIRRKALYRAKVIASKGGPESQLV